MAQSALVTCAVDVVRYSRNVFGISHEGRGFEKNFDITLHYIITFQYQIWISDHRVSLCAVWSYFRRRIRKLGCEVLNLECEEWSGCLVMHILLGTFEICAGHFGDISKITTIDIWLQMWVSWQFHVTFMWFQETYLQIHYHIQTSNSTVWILPFKKFMSDSLRMIKMTKIQIHLISNSFGFIGDSLWFRFRFTILFQPSELWIWNLLGLSIHIAWCHCHPQKYMCVCCCNDIHYTVWNPRTKDLCIYVT